MNKENIEIERTAVGFYPDEEGGANHTAFYYFSHMAIGDNGVQEDDIEAALVKDVQEIFPEIGIQDIDLSSDDYEDSGTSVVVHKACFTGPFNREIARNSKIDFEAHRYYFSCVSFAFSDDELGSINIEEASEVLRQAMQSFNQKYAPLFDFDASMAKPFQEDEQPQDDLHSWHEFKTSMIFNGTSPFGKGFRPLSGEIKPGGFIDRLQSHLKSAFKEAGLDENTIQLHKPLTQRTDMIGFVIAPPK